MRLNKFAPFGQLPAPAGASQTLRAKVGGLDGSSALMPKFDELSAAVARADSSGAIQALAAALRPLAGLPQAVADANAVTATGFARLEDGIGRLVDVTRAAAGPAKVPSAAAFRILARLSQVHDALCDQKRPTLENANKRLESERTAAATRESSELLARSDPALASAFDAQFRPLGDAQEFELQRRVRLAELLGVEWRVMADIEDDAASRAIS